MLDPLTISEFVQYATLDQETESMLHAATREIRRLRDLLADVRRAADVVGGDQIIRDKCRKAGLTLDDCDQPVWADG